MYNIYLCYNKKSSNDKNNLIFGKNLKLKLDNNLTTSVGLGNIHKFEVDKGKHNLKMYQEGWSKDALVGYVDKDVDVNEDLYFIYKRPITVFGRGKLIENKFNSIDEFKEYINKMNKKRATLNFIGISLFVCVVLYMILFL